MVQVDDDDHDDDHDDGDSLGSSSLFASTIPSGAWPSPRPLSARAVNVQNKIIYKGNQLYLQEAFPHMSYIKTEAVTVLEP